MHHTPNGLVQYFETIQTLIIKLKGIYVFYLKSSCQIHIKFGVYSLLMYSISCFQFDWQHAAVLALVVVVAAAAMTETCGGHQIN